MYNSYAFLMVKGAPKKNMDKSIGKYGTSGKFWLSSFHAKILTIMLHNTLLIFTYFGF